MRADRLVVIGGGIAGAFAAFFASRAGLDVVLVERKAIGGAASGTNPGGLNPLHGPGIPGPLATLALQSFGLHLDHWDEIAGGGLEFDGHRTRRLNLAVDGGDVDSLTQMKDRYDATPGFGAAWLDAEEIAAVEPRLRGDFTAGLMAEGDATVAPAAYTRAVAAAAERHGAEIVAAEARGLDFEHGRVTHVLTDRDALDCDAVVIATGAWCEGPAQWLDTTLPVEPVKGELVLVEIDGDELGADVTWRDTGLYRVRDRHTLLGGTEERQGLDDSTTASARASIVERAARVLPAVARARVVEHTAALRPMTPDGRPIIGLAPGCDNVGLALGGGRKGMLLGAVMGRAAVDLVTTGETPMAIASCGPERFTPA